MFINKQVIGNLFIRAYCLLSTIVITRSYTLTVPYVVIYCLICFITIFVLVRECILVDVSCVIQSSTIILGLYSCLCSCYVFVYLASENEIEGIVLENGVPKDTVLYTYYVY